MTVDNAYASVPNKREVLIVEGRESSEKGVQISRGGVGKSISKGKA